MPWCITKSPVVRSFTVVCLVLLFSASSSGEEPEIAFDVPALVGVRVIDVDGAHVEDPFGLIFEVYSHSYELTYSQGAY